MMKRDKSTNRKAQAVLVAGFLIFFFLFSSVFVRSAIQTTTLSATTIYVTTIDELTAGGYVNILKLLVEKGTSHPVVAATGYLFFREDWDELTMYNGSSWLNLTGSGVSDHGALTGLGDDDHTIYILADGSRALTADWNIGGSYGVYGATWINSTSINADYWYWNGINRTDTIAYPEQTATYTFFKSGTTLTYTSAKNGVTGQIEWNMTDSSTVIQNGLNAGGDNAYYFTKEGNYSLTNVLVFGDNLTFQGAGEGTLFRVADHTWETLTTNPNLEVSGSQAYLNGFMLSKHDASGYGTNFIDYAKNIHLKDFTLDVNGANQNINYTTIFSYYICAGIKLCPAAFCSVEGVTVENGCWGNIILYGANGVTFDVPSFNKIVGCKVTGAGVGIPISDSMGALLLDDQSSEGSIIESNNIYDCTIAAICVEDAADTKIIGNTIINCYYGISLATAKNTQVENNFIMNTTGDSIVLSSDCSWSSIKGNTLRNAGRYGIYSPSGADFIGNKIIAPNDVGIYLRSGQLNIIGNTITDAGQNVTAPYRSGIIIDLTSYDISNSIITDNYIIDDYPWSINPSGGQTMQYGIWAIGIARTVPYVTFKNNFVAYAVTNYNLSLITWGDDSWVEGNIRDYNEFWYDSSNCTDIIANSESESSYTIFYDSSDSLYKAKNQSTGQIDYQSTNKTEVQEDAETALSSGGLIYCKEITWDTAVTLSNDVIVMEEYQGKLQYYSNQGKFLLPQLASDPSTAGWGSAEQGYMWFNTAEGKIKFWDGSVIQTLPSITGGGTYKLTPAYTIYKSGSTYYAMDEDGNIDYSSTNASYTVNSADNVLSALGGGTMIFKGYDYTFTAGISLGRENRIKGEGSRITTFTVSGSFNMITIESSVGTVDYCWAIEGIGIDMNGHGTGIYSAYSSQSGHRGQCSIIDVFITDIASGYCGIWLVNPFFLKQDMIDIRNNTGTGMKFTIDETPLAHLGNSEFDRIYIAVSGNNAVGLNVTDGTTYRTANLVQFNRFQVFSGNKAYTGTFGIWWKSTTALSQNVQFNALDIEMLETGVYLDGMYYMTFIEPLVMTEGSLATAYGFRLVGACRDINVIGGYISAGDNAASKGWSDESTSTAYKHTIMGTRIDNYYGDFETNTKLYNVKATRIGAGVGRNSEYSGSQTNTTATTVVISDHGCFYTPNIINCRFSTSAVTGWYVSAVDSTSETITFTGTGLPATIMLYVENKYDPTFNDPS